MVSEKFQDQPLTVAYIRDQIRKNQLIGDAFTALRFLLNEYDQLNTKLKTYTRPTEYTIVSETVRYKNSQGLDVV